MKGKSTESFKILPKRQISFIIWKGYVSVIRDATSLRFKEPCSNLRKEVSQSVGQVERRELYDTDMAVAISLHLEIASSKG
jgi:hypothetical protein